MNEVLGAIRARRSCRSYLAKQVDEETLRQILEAGTYAPSGMGAQSALMVVVQDPDTVARLERMNAAVMGGGGHPFYGAPTVVVVFADSSRFTFVEDGSLVIGTLLLAADSLGVGGCWVHRAKEVFQTPEGRELMKAWGIPENYVGVGHCVLGYASKDPAPAKPRKRDYIRRV